MHISKTFNLIFNSFLVLLLSAISNPVQSTPEVIGFLQHLKLPVNIEPISEKDKIVIAIVDDGVRITHQDIRNFIWNNPLETPGNGIDDDGNGYVDDYHGWDVADNNNRVTPPENSRISFYHGTHLAGIISQIAQEVYGDKASDYIKIMPVKSIKDDTDKAYIKSGYKGIEYAVKAGADIVLSAWGVAHISNEEIKILQDANKKKVLIVSAAGNFSTQKKQYPAAAPSVLAVAALDSSSRKTEKSNFGGFIDLSTAGMEILSAGINSDTDYAKHEGTSQASAIVAITAAMVSLQHPDYSWEMVKACLKNTSDVINVSHMKYTAKLGAGALNIGAAVGCDLFNKNTNTDNTLHNPQGYLHLANLNKNAATWTIKLNGRSKGIRFNTASKAGDVGNSVITFYKDDSPDSQPFMSYPLAKLPTSVYVPGTTAVIRFEPKDTSKKLDWLVEYRAEPINFSKLYCHGEKVLRTEGTIEDGSGADNYSFNSDCKWLITAPKGKVIRFRFAEFDTEGGVDKVYLFNGDGTHEQIMAIISGAKKPPEITSWRNQVLIWFVSDEKNQGNGWKIEYSFQDPLPIGGRSK